MLEDIAILTGGRVIVRGARRSSSRMSNVDDLGRAQRAWSIDKDNTTIIGGARRQEARSRRGSNQIRAADREDHQRLRQARSSRSGSRKLAGGVAVIRVGAPSEAEMKSRKEAFDDAISATKAAVTEGIVPGGGLALLRAIDAVDGRGSEV